MVIVLQIAACVKRGAAIFLLTALASCASTSGKTATGVARNEQCSTQNSSLGIGVPFPEVAEMIVSRFPVSNSLEGFKNVLEIESEKRPDSSERNYLFYSNVACKRIDEMYGEHLNAIDKAGLSAGT